MNLKKICFTANIVLGAVMLAFDIWFLFYGKLVIKGITSALFVAAGGVNLFYAVKSRADIKFPIVMLSGLVFAMAGDIVLNIVFIAGAALFAIGHVFYFAAYCVLYKFRPLDLILGACVFVPSVLIITLVPIFDYGGILMEIVCVVYALIISLMVGKAISALVKNRSVLSLFIAVGSIMFYVSDFALLINVFGSIDALHFPMRALCLCTYYPAQLLLAFTLFVYTVFGKEKKIREITRTEADENAQKT